MLHIENKWKGKWVLVTGGSDRVGKGICEYLAAQGMNIIIHARTDRPSLHTLKEELERSYGVEVKAVTGELTDETAVKAIFEQCSPDVVVNNAAVFAGDMAANRDAPLLVTREAIDQMRKDGRRGVVFFVGDAFAERGGKYPDDLDEYVRSKMWIRAKVDEFAPLGKEGIRVLGIMNGPIEPAVTTLPKVVADKVVADIAAEINMPSDTLNPWIGGWRDGEAIYFALNAEAVAGLIFVDGGRLATKPAPSER